MKLRDMTTDQILQQLEVRSGALLDMERKAGELDANLKAFEATSAIALRDSGLKSMTEAELRARASVTWAEMYLELQRTNAETAAAKRNYQRAVIASDLYRTEMATIRAVERA